MKLTNKEKFAIRCAVITGVCSNPSFINSETKAVPMPDFVYESVALFTNELIAKIEGEDNTNPEEQEGD